MIATLDELVKEAEGLAVDLTDEIINDDGNAAAARGSILGSYVARTAKMLADAKYHQDMAQHNALSLIYTENPKMPPSIAKDLAQSKCAVENRVVTLIERLNRAATHQYSFCVTIISKAKAEMQLQPRM
jgi:hypothetical protein